MSNVAYKKLQTEYDRVAIIDILSDSERKSLQISARLVQVLKFNDIGGIWLNFNDSSGLMNGLKLLLDRAKAGEKFPIHFVGHANQAGLAFANDNMSWPLLGPALETINRHQNGNLILNMTTCFGLHALKSINLHTESAPFFGVIGTKFELSIADAIDVNRRFYDKIRSGIDITQIVKQMNSERKDDLLHCLTAQEYKEIVAR